MATKVLIGQWSDGLEALIKATKVDEGQLRNAVNSALGQLLQKDEEETKGRSKIVAATKEKPESFRLTEKTITRFEGLSHSALRVYQLNQDLTVLEKTMGQIDLNGWPSRLEGWIKKFQEQPKEQAA